ncbi:DNA-binding protein SMUBP-2 [Cephus cinctus]|uniref:DNA-binding protein SMUBP-2 n=1 Tax=Cephus cinctus TaxID=211228 RepID=A0AAJ7CFH4_CEPCN|nr:DNA-binding protein SMUBP-2 [Cephus cinctus]
MEENISKLVQQHLKLLQLEQEENLQHFLKDVSPNVLRNLEAQGQALTKLVMSNTAAKGLEGRHIEFMHADEIPLKPGLAVGDTVILICSNRKEESVRGLVEAVSEMTISIMIDNYRLEPPVEDEKYCLVQVNSDFTYKCQTRALNNLRSKNICSWHCADVIRILFDNTEISLPLLTTEVSLPREILDENEKLILANPNLVEDQHAAVMFALRRKHFAIIQGPPGTGKTTTIVELIIQLKRIGKKVLVCAPTNVAVDNVAIKLGPTEAKPLRLGHPARMMEAARNYSMDAMIQQDDNYTILNDIKRSIKDIKQTEQENGAVSRRLRELDKEYWNRSNRLMSDILRRHSVVLCTLNSATPGENVLRHVPKDYFNVIIVDEASQALEASTWIALPNAEKAILVGDFNQLPPVVMCKTAADRGLNVSLMERAVKKLSNEAFRSLCLQFRMNKEIMSWSNEQFYKNNLEASSTVAGHLLKDLPAVQDTAITSNSLVFVDTCGCDCEEYGIGFDTISKGNMGEAIVVDAVVAALVCAGVSQNDIGVITPYALQVDFIRRLLATRSITVEVSTVDSFQGREKEAIVLSLVRSNEQKDLGFVTDFRRLNVAVTRARRLLTVIADSETVEDNKLIASLLKHIENHGLLQTAQEYLTDASNEIKDRLAKGTKIKQKNVSVPEKSGKKDKSADKASKKSNKKGDVPKIPKVEGVGLNETLNRKNYNPFETIAASKIEDELKDLKTTEEMMDFEAQVDNDVKKVEELKGIAELSILITKLNATRKDQQQEDGSSTQTTSKPSTNRKRNKNKNKAIEPSSDKDDDIDKIIATVTANDYVCGMNGCKKSTQLIHQTCEFCKTRFCLQHGMQEIHGCGDAIRQKERNEFRHKKPEPATQRSKQKFAQKLKQLEQARMPKKKSTK